MRNGAPFSDTPHVCRYLKQLVWSKWRRSGDLAERLARWIPQCEVCGREQPNTLRRPPVLREVRARTPEAPPPVDATGLKIAKALARLAMGREGLLPTGRFFPDLARRGIPASLTAEWIEAFRRAGLVTVVWRPGNPPSLVAVTLWKRPALRKLIKSAGKKPPSPPQPSSPEREEGDGQEGDEE